MKFILEVPENKIAFAEEFFKSVSFIKKIRAIAPNEIINNAILKEIENYEKNQTSETRLSSKYRGILSKEQGTDLNKHINQMRDEWNNI